MQIQNALITGSFSYNGADLSNITSSNAYSASLSIRTTDLESTSSVLVGASSSFSSILSSVSSSQQQISASLLTLTASYNALSSSYTALSASYNTASSSFSTRITSDSSSMSSRTTQVEKTYASTGSNTFTGLQNFSNTCTPNSFTAGASIYTAGGLQVTQDSYFSSSVYIKGNVTVYGTQSVSYVSSSQFNIGTNIITVNTFTPSVRYGGLSVFDSGSTGLTGSIFWDSELNRWIYVNASGSGGGATYGGGMFISGPRNTQGIGCEQGTTACMLLVGQGGDHLTSSLIYHDSTVTCIPNAIVGGSTISGTTIYGSTAVCSAVGKFTTCLDLGGALTGTSATFSNSVTANNTSTFSNASSLSAIFSNGGSASNYNSIELRGGTVGSTVNWQISKDNSTGNAFELAASTTAGGTTYGSPVFKILNTGAATFSAATQDATQTVIRMSGNNASSQLKALDFKLTAGTPLWTISTAAVGTDAGINIMPNGNAGLSLTYAGAASFACSVGIGTTLAVTGTTSLSCRLSIGASDQTYASIFIGGALTTGTNQWAIITDPQLSGTDSNYALYANARIKACTAVTNAFGVYIPSAEKLSGATITNNYALYIANQTSGATLNYSIYSSGGLNYFGGCVGIGTSTPSAKLNIFGTPGDGSVTPQETLLSIGGNELGNSGGYNGIRLGGTQTSSYGVYIRGVKQGNYGSYWDTALTFSVTRTSTTTTIDEVMRITSGAITCFAGTVCAPCFATISDYRMKSNIRPIAGLSIIMNTKPYKFEYNYDCSTSFGMIAHELQDTLPEAVFGQKDGEVMQGVDYMKLLPIAIKAIQEQQCKIALLESCLGIA